MQRKEIPILFSTLMVQAILQGRKWVTRRVVTKNNSKTTGKWAYLDFSDVVVDGKGFKDEYLKVAQTLDDTRHRVFNRISAGDVLWARESFFNHFGNWVYCANWDQHGNKDKAKWKPSIHMPKAAARIWLEVVAVRVERLKDITEEQAKAEGVPQGIFREGPNTSKGEFHLELNHHARHTEGFKYLWHQINGRESWDANPWVWVVEFKVLSTTGKPQEIPPSEGGKGDVVPEYDRPCNDDTED